MAYYIYPEFVEEWKLNWRIMVCESHFLKNADLQSDILSSSQFQNVSHINGEIIHTKWTNGAIKIKYLQVNFFCYLHSHYQQACSM